MGTACAARRDSLFVFKTRALTQMSILAERRDSDTHLV